MTLVSLQNTSHPQLDVLLITYGPASMGQHGARVAAYIVWALCSGIVGALDAAISTVAYGESAAMGPAYTHVSSLAAFQQRAC